MWECLSRGSKDLHPSWESRPLRKKIKKGQQLTSLWLNIKHTVGLHFVLREEAQREENCSLCQVIFQFDFLVLCYDKKKDMIIHLLEPMRNRFM